MQVCYKNFEILLKISVESQDLEEYRVQHSFDNAASEWLAGMGRPRHPAQVTEFYFHCHRVTFQTYKFQECVECLVSNSYPHTLMASAAGTLQRPLVIVH
jgi:hypothetical protein